MSKRERERERERGSTWRSDCTSVRDRGRESVHVEEVVVN